MSSQNVAVRRDVYEALRHEKRPRESFTQLFLRLLNQRGPLDELHGAWAKAPTAAETRAYGALRGGRSSARRSR
ncbi:MAG: antitoxin VapB family protein [Thermoplasmata archaeon]|nr:antitoxin VapB family protein [Thermoplasmata archaeon]MCI4355060.1 antitoxin VapB family protein [Thermoplasmata archaeon]